MKHGYYVADPYGTPAWYNYWMEQRKRCIEGYTYGGSKITGDHYFYLNFCPIQKVDDPLSNKSRKTEGFPDFWDGDYNYFWIREIAKHGIFDSIGNNKDKKDSLEHLKELFDSLYLEIKIEPKYLKGGWNIIVGKSRRKGYSYKSAAIATKNYYTKPNSYTAFGAYEKKFLYPKGLFSMSTQNINFINGNTGWGTPSDVIQKQDHIKASYIEYKNGIKLEKGFMSEIQALSFKDNPNALYDNYFWNKWRY